MRYEKIAPGLLVEFGDYQREGRRGVTQHIRALGRVSAEGSLEPARSVVFVRCDKQAGLARGNLAREHALHLVSSHNSA